MCTAMTTRVRGVIRSHALVGEMSRVSRSMSAKMGTACNARIAATVPMSVIGVVMTSSPSATPSAARAVCRAAVPEVTAMMCSIPKAAPTASSNSSTIPPGPMR